jgi:hypothetical protein
MTKLVRIFNTNIFSQIDSFIGIYKWCISFLHN